MRKHNNITGLFLLASFGAMATSFVAIGVFGDIRVFALALVTSVICTMVTAIRQYS